MNLNLATLPRYIASAFFSNHSGSNRQENDEGPSDERRRTKQACTLRFLTVLIDWFPVCPGSFDQSRAQIWNGLLRCSDKLVCTYLIVQPL